MNQKRGYQEDHSGNERGRRERGEIVVRIGLIALLAMVCVCTVRELTKEWQGSAWQGFYDAVRTGREQAVEVTADGGYIKWVEFHAPCEAMNAAYELDVETYRDKIQLHWIELLAYEGTRTGGSFDTNSARKIRETGEKIKSGEMTMEKLTKDMKYYNYYLEAYTAVLGGMVGEFTLDGKHYYGLKAFSPIAKGFDYSHYDDFGSSRSYGYSRPHLGHDMMGQIGTPIIAVESGYVEALGWNQYGGWRIGIRSFDGKRYYYYAHLRQNYPYAEGLAEGDVVTAGDVIGYMGHTGYSAKENVNNIKTVHLHWGLQLIFDESQKEGNNEIWVDCYEITKFLYKNRSEVEKAGESREWHRTTQMTDPAVEAWKEQKRKSEANPQPNRKEGAGGQEDQ